MFDPIVEPGFRHSVPAYPLAAFLPGGQPHPAGGRFHAVRVRRAQSLLREASLLG